MRALAANIGLQQLHTSFKRKQLYCVCDWIVCCQLSSPSIFFIEESIAQHNEESKNFDNKPELCVGKGPHYFALFAVSALLEDNNDDNNQSDLIFIC